MRIPKRFKVLGQEITVRYSNTHLYKLKFLGMFYPDRNLILLANKYKESGIWKLHPQDKIEATFYHELTHCILFHMGHKHWMNEKLVDDLSGLLHQFLTTAEYE